MRTFGPYATRFLLRAGVFVACFFFLNTTRAQIQPADSIKSDTLPSPELIKGKGGFENDSIYTNVRPREAVNPPTPKTEADKASSRAIKDKDKPDTLRPHSPKLAMGMSALLPGLGQAYNRKYWKMPIVYAGLGVGVYFIWTETKTYRRYKETYSLRLGLDSLATDWFPNATNNTVKEMKEYHHQNMEIAYIATGLFYLLNIIDAAVDAHLYDFDVSDDLSMRIEPSMLSLSTIPLGAPGLSVKLKF